MEVGVGTGPVGACIAGWGLTRGFLLLGRSGAGGFRHEGGLKGERRSRAHEDVVEEKDMGQKVHGMYMWTCHVAFVRLCNFLKLKIEKELGKE